PICPQWPCSGSAVGVPTQVMGPARPRASARGGRAGPCWGRPRSTWHRTPRAATTAGSRSIVASPGARQPQRERAALVLAPARRPAPPPVCWAHPRAQKRPRPHPGRVPPALFGGPPDGLKAPAARPPRRADAPVTNRHGHAAVLAPDAHVHLSAVRAVLDGVF